MFQFESSTGGSGLSKSALPLVCWCSAPAVRSGVSPRLISCVLKQREVDCAASFEPVLAAGVRRPLLLPRSCAVVFSGKRPLKTEILHVQRQRDWWLPAPYQKRLGCWRIQRCQIWTSFWGCSFSAACRLRESQPLVTCVCALKQVGSGSSCSSESPIAPNAGSSCAELWSLIPA